MCWGVGEVRGDVGKGEEMWGSVGGSVLGPDTRTHFHTPPPFLSPQPFPTRHHIFLLTQCTLLHPSPHFSTPHTSFLTSPHTPTHFPTPPPTPHTSSHSSPHLPLCPTHFPIHPCTLPHLSPHLSHSFICVAKSPCDDVTLINLTGQTR